VPVTSRVTVGSLALSVAAASCIHRSQPSPVAAAERLTGCYQLHLSGQELGTFDAGPRPAQLRLTLEPVATSGTPSRQYKAVVDYQLLPGDSIVAGADFTPSWSAEPPESLEVDLGWHRPQVQWVIRARRLAAGLEGTMGIVSERGFWSLFHVAATKRDCP
jgi:hypothetical protein